MGAAEYTRPAARPAVISAQKVLFELQVEQHHHDELYHREIARLPMHQRLNHMALHFAKYAGKVAATNDIEVAIPVLVDTLVIALSTANILNIDLWEFIEPDKREFPSLVAFGRSLAANMPNEMAELAAFVRQMTIAAGRMAAASEKIDHLEEIPFRAEMRHAVARLCSLALALISLKGIEPAQAVRERLAKVKERLKLHGRI